MIRYAVLSINSHISRRISRTLSRRRRDHPTADSFQHMFDRDHFATIMANAWPNLTIYDSIDRLNHPPNMLYPKTLGSEVVYVE